MATVEQGFLHAQLEERRQRLHAAVHGADAVGVGRMTGDAAAAVDLLAIDGIGRNGGWRPQGEEERSGQESPAHRSHL